MQGDPIKRCPDCGSEYQMWVERCLDCGASLVLGREGQSAAVPGPKMELDELTYPDECVHLRTAPPAWIGQLTEKLDEAGIRHWVSPPEWQRDPSLHVLLTDLEAARAIDRELYAIEGPEIREEEARSQRSGRPRREPSAYAQDVKVCPSCGERLPEGAVECPGCGLAVAQPDVCPRCGAEFETAVQSCRNCGYEIYGFGES